MQPAVDDQAIQREVLATLKANPAASLDTVLGNWRYHRHGFVGDAETSRVETILGKRAGRDDKAEAHRQ